jgi:hypothetical protein
MCGEYMGPFKNELTVVTGFSEKTIQEIIGEKLLMNCQKVGVFEVNLGIEFNVGSTSSN